MATVDVESLYTNIKQSNAMAAVKWALGQTDLNKSKSVPFGRSIYGYV